MITATFDLERKLLGDFVTVAGIDEVGRGPLAGPVVAGCVLVDTNSSVVDGVRDSKTLSEKQRVEMEKEIKAKSLAYGIGLSSVEEIDELGLTEAISRAMQRSIENMLNGKKIEIGIIVIDGANVQDIPGFQQMKIDKADVYHYSVASASIIAKNFRDNLMKEYAKKYPEYGFERHVGYGTKFHLEMLQKYGPCPIHRKSFKPVKQLL